MKIVSVYYTHQIKLLYIGIYPHISVYTDIYRYINIGILTHNRYIPSVFRYIPTVYTDRYFGIYRYIGIYRRYFGIYRYIGIYRRYQNIDI